MPKLFFMMGEKLMLRFIDAGESHGEALIAIIDGFPSNFIVDVDFINNELRRRQQGYGRGERMKLEKDKIKILSGLRGSKTTGNPITFLLYNKEYEKWKDILTGEPEENERITIPRPGHGDFSGYVKYETGDIRNVIERASARETAIRTAAGALCRELLYELNIIIRSKIHSIGSVIDALPCEVDGKIYKDIDLFDEFLYKNIENSSVRCFNKDSEEKIKNLIDDCKAQGETIGGSIFVSIKGMPIGVGSYTQWDRKLDANLSRAICSIQGIKAIEFGKGLNSELMGSQFNDGFFFEGEKINRFSNNAGGIEAGMSNGENIEFKAYMKPIPTVRKTISTIDLKQGTNTESRYERSDVCGVVPASIVLENVCAYEILKELLLKFPADTFGELKHYVEEYNKKNWRYSKNG